MTDSDSYTRLRRATPLSLCALLLLIGLLGTGCGSSGAVQKSVSSSAPVPEKETTVTKEKKANEQKTQTQEQSKTTSAEPVKVLRLEKVRSRIKKAAQDWYGTPYEWGGESKNGVDCSGFVKNVYEDAFSYTLPRVTESQLQSGSKVERDQIRPGDLVFFRPENQYNHVGVYLGKGNFVHASSSEGVTKSALENNYWKKYYWTTRRPLKPSKVPDKLEGKLVAYKYPESDSTVRLADAKTETSNTTQKTGDQKTSDQKTNETSNTKSTESEGTKIASCAAEGVECADPSNSSTESSDSEGDERKGW